MTTFLMTLLSGEEENVKMVEKENKEIKKAVETLNRISLDPKERELYDSIVLQEFNRQVGLQNTFDSGKIAGIAEGKIEGIAEGKIAGRAEGQKDKQLEIAKKLLEENIVIEVISKTTGLSIAEIEKLSSKI